MTTLKIEMPPKMIPAFAPKRGELRYRCFKGGRGSGKSFTVAMMAAIWGAIEPLRILCTRELQNSIRESFHAELKNAIESNAWLASQYDVGVDYLRHKTNGTEFIFKGLRHNITAVKSMAQIDLLIVEEAETVPHESWIDLLPTIRIPRSEIWIIWNSKRPNSWVAENFDFDPPPRSIVVTLNHRDNPWFSSELEEQRLNDKAKMPESLYNHIWEGEYLLDDDQAVIKLGWINSAIDAHKLLPEIATGRARLGFDIADSGEDSCATILVKGGLALGLDEWRAGEDELMKSSSRAFANATKEKALIVYDSIGVGASAGSHFKEINAKTTPSNRLQFSAFNAGAKVFKPKADYQHKIKNEDFFANLKAQSWWLVADRFKLTHQVVEAIKAGKEPPKYKPDDLIALDSALPKLEQLKTELATPHRDFDNYGRVKVESKKDLAKRGIKSPNLADAAIMAFAPIQTGIKINAGMLR